MNEDDCVEQNLSLRIPRGQRSASCLNDLLCGARTLKAAVCVDKAANTGTVQPLSFGTEVAEPGSVLWCNHKHGAEVPRKVQRLVESPQILSLQARANFTLACLKLPQSEVRVNGIEDEPKAVLHVEYGASPHEQLHARSDGHPSGRFKRRQDLVGDAGPDHGIRLGKHDAI